MSETDPGGLHEKLEGEADRLEEQSQRLGGDVQDARQDWEQKRSDPGVPGAVPPDQDEEEQDEGQKESPDPQAPPPSEGPSAAETAQEGATGPPKDQLEDHEGGQDQGKGGDDGGEGDEGDQAEGKTNQKGDNEDEEE
jgi:hypothetical protein